MNNLVEHLSRTFKIDKSDLTNAIEDFNRTHAEIKIVSEPAVSNQKLSESSLTDSISKDTLLVNIESEQSSPDLISNVLDKTGLTMKFLAEEVFEITPKTFAKYKKETSHLPKRFLELSFKLIGLYELGSEIFGSTSAFNQWCEKPAIGLNFTTPKNYFSTVTGIECITEELQRILIGYPV